MFTKRRNGVIFDLKSWVTGETKIQPGIPSCWRIFESNWFDIESQLELTLNILSHVDSSQFDINIPLFLENPWSNFSSAMVTQLFRSKWLIFSVLDVDTIVIAFHLITFNGFKGYNSRGRASKCDSFCGCFGVTVRWKWWWLQHLPYTGRRANRTRIPTNRLKPCQPFNIVSHTKKHGSPTNSYMYYHTFFFQLK